jgi:hypothetical protein
VSSVRIALDFAGLMSKSEISPSAFARRSLVVRIPESSWIQPVVYFFWSAPLSVTSSELSLVRRTTLSTWLASICSRNFA